MPALKAGSRLKSTVCTTEVIIVKAPAGAVEVEVTCGGAPMALGTETITERGEAAADAKNGTALGKRYVNADETLGPVLDGKKKVTMFELTKLVNNHLSSP